MPVYNAYEDVNQIRKSHPKEHYITPVSLAYEALYWLTDKVQYHHKITILDSGFGLGSFGFAASKVWPKNIINGVDIRNIQALDCYSNSWNNTDFMKLDPNMTYDICLGNPPFSLAEEFVNKAAKVARHVFYLLPLAFLESQSRARGLFLHFPPSNVLICSKRPSWWLYSKNRKNTNQRAYAFFHWDKDQQTKVHWLTWDYNEQLERAFKGLFFESLMAPILKAARYCGGCNTYQDFKFWKMQENICDSCCWDGLETQALGESL